MVGINPYVRQEKMYKEKEIELMTSISDSLKELTNTLNKILIKFEEISSDNKNTKSKKSTTSKKSSK